MRHYKYVHMLWGKDIKFIGPLVSIINTNPDVFCQDDHLFITSKESVKNALPPYSNIIFDENGTPAELINRYSKIGTWIISHGMASGVYQVRRRHLEKIIWRTWGGSRQKTQWDNQHIFSSCMGKIKDVLYYLYYRYSYGCSPVIGIANTVDRIDLEQWNWHKNAKLLPINYIDSSIDQCIRKTNPTEFRTSTIKFLIGHQGDPGENHVSLLKNLLKYDSEVFEVYLPLSYGNQKYIDFVKSAVLKLNDKRVHVLDEFMPFEDYLKFLASVDVAIIDEKSSMALGNISFLLYFNKKLLLNKDGVLRKAFDNDGLPYMLTDSLGNISFSELVTPFQYKEPVTSDLSYQPLQHTIKEWCNLFDYLETLHNE